MGSKAILVVDDEPEIGEVIAFLLGSYGYQVRYAFNGSDALQMLAQAPADLVLTDLMMPVLDGSELVRMMRAMEAFSMTPILVASATPEDTVRQMCPLASAFLAKPFTAPQLLGAVRQLLDLPKTPNEGRDEASK